MLPNFITDDTNVAYSTTVKKQLKLYKVYFLINLLKAMFRENARRNGDKNITISQTGGS